MSIADATGEPATGRMIASTGPGNEQRPATRPPPGRGRAALAQSWCDERAAIPSAQGGVNADRGAERAKIGEVKDYGSWEVTDPAHPDHPSAYPNRLSDPAAGPPVASGSRPSSRPRRGHRRAARGRAPQLPAPARP